jgi:phosphopantothenoylcysteine decarboxylase/phosphopantothenate--cysteine ligase
VTLVAGPVHLPTPRGVRASTCRARSRCTTRCCRWRPQHDVFVATAAVADWRPAQAVAEHKIKKDGSGQVPALASPRTPTSWPPWRAARIAPWCVGFAAESHDLVRHAREKRCARACR